MSFKRVELSNSKLIKPVKELSNNENAVIVKTTAKLDDDIKEFFLKHFENVEKVTGERLARIDWDDKIIQLTSYVVGNDEKFPKGYSDNNIIVVDEYHP